MRIHFADFVVLYPQRVETRVASTHFRNGLKHRCSPLFRKGLKPLAHKSVMATPFVRGYGPTASGGLTGEGGNPAYPNRFQSPLIPLF